MQVETNTKPKKKWLIIVIVLLIVAIVAVNIIVVQNQNKSSAVNLEFVAVQERDFAQSKLISGMIVEGEIDSYHVDSTKGEIDKLFVKEGQKVKENQKLFSYKDSELSYQLKQMDIDQRIASISYDQGKKTIDMLEKQINNIEKDRENAIKTATETATETAADPIQTEQLDQTKQDIERQLQDAKAQLQTTVLEMDKSNLQEEELKRKQEDLIVYSRSAGVVKKIDPDYVLSEQIKPYIQISSGEPYQIQGQVTELQKAQILPDQAVTITSKALPDQSWKGKIKEVASSPLTAEESAGEMTGTGSGSNPTVSYYPFIASLDSQKNLSPGFHVSLEVDLPNIKKIAVPSESIMEEAEESYVYILKNNKVHRQSVITGIGDGQWTEVIEGVSKGDKLVAHPSPTMSEGMEVNEK